MAQFSNGNTAGHLYGKFKGNVLQKPRLSGASALNKIGAVVKGITRGKSKGIPSPVQLSNTFNLARCTGHFDHLASDEKKSWSDYGAIISMGILSRKTEILFGFQGYCASCLFCLKFTGSEPLDFSTYSWTGYPSLLPTPPFSVSLSPFSFVFKYTQGTHGTFAMAVFASAPMSPGRSSAFGVLSAIGSFGCINDTVWDMASFYLAVYGTAPQVGQAINFAFYLFNIDVGMQVFMNTLQYVF